MLKHQQQPAQQHSPQQPYSLEILQLQLNQQIQQQQHLQQQNQPLQQQVDRALGLIIPDLSTVTRM
jgi:hypothetical protein